MAAARAPSVVDDLLGGDRLMAWCRVLAVCICVGIIGFLALSAGGLDYWGKPLGTDFASFYAASKLALVGKASAAYDVAQHMAVQNAIFGRDVIYAAFFYPPIYLLMCLPLALLPYVASLLVWQGLTLAAYWRVVAAFGGAHLPLLPIFAFPAVLINLGHGQNAFLTTALFGAALLTLNARPILAGVFIGCLAYKPQLGIVIPFALLAARRWQTIFSAGATVVVLAALSTLAFGVDIWRAFLANAPMATAALEQGLVGDFKMQSTFAGVRVLGGSIALGYTLQAVVSVAVIAAAMVVAVRPDDRARDLPVIAPILPVAALLVSPFVLDYDFALLALPLAWLFAEGRRTGFLPYEKVVGVAAFALPLFARSLAGGAHLPLAPVVIGALFLVLLRRAMADRSRPALAQSF